MEGAETTQAAWIAVTEERLAKLERGQDRTERDTKRLKQDLQELRSLHLLSSSDYLVFSDNSKVVWYFNRAPNGRNTWNYRIGDFLMIYRYVLLAERQLAKCTPFDGV